MRLKIFFAPVAFLVAIIVSISYIWPSIQDIIGKREELKKSQETFNSIMQKKENASSLLGGLDRNKEKEEFLTKFFPQAGSEERIIDGINYLSIDSSADLINVVITKEKSEIANESSGTSQTLSSGAGTAGSSDKAGNTFPIVEKPKTSFLDAEITLKGKYENIKNFVGQLNRMEMLSGQISLEIKKPENGKIGEVAVEPDILLAVVKAKFGSLSPVKGERIGELEIFSRSDLDFNPYSNFYNVVVSKIPALEEGDKGRANPFLP